MNEPEQATVESTKRIVNVGPDRVTVADNEVIIEARHELPEWDVRGSVTPAIYFEDRKYLLVAKDPAEKPFACRYHLRPWPEGRNSIYYTSLDYNAEVVAERDASKRGDMWDQAIWCLLLPLYPFLGLCWSGMQTRLVRFGFLPRSLTGISIFSAFLLFFVQAVIVSVLINASLRSGKLMIGGVFTALTGHNFISLGFMNFPTGVVDGLLILSLGLDAAIRYTIYLRDDQWTGGFLEWLVPASKRKE